MRFSGPWSPCPLKDSEQAAFPNSGISDSLPPLIQERKRTDGSEPRAGAPDLVFLQLDGKTAVRARVAGREIDFASPGFAEVFVPSAGR